MSEKKIINWFVKAGTLFGGRLFRNNVGVGWAGDVKKIHRPEKVRVNEGDVVIRRARPLHAGLCKGSSDVIGWLPVVVTEDMVGKTLAVFTAVEIKTPGVNTTQEQSAFINTVKGAGGIAGVTVVTHETEHVATEMIQGIKDRFNGDITT